MKRLRPFALCLLLLSATACARTVYTNLHPQAPVPAVTPAPDPARPLYWRHFFIFGWVPGELRIDARAYCDGTEHIDRIETRQSFVQGLIEALAGWYINVYSPYTGRVVCDRHARESDEPGPDASLPAWASR